METAKARLQEKGIPPADWPSVMGEIEEKKTEKNEPMVDPSMAAFLA